MHSWHETLNFRGQFVKRVQSTFRPTVFHALLIFPSAHPACCRPSLPHRLFTPPRRSNTREPRSCRRSAARGRTSLRLLTIGRVQRLQPIETPRLIPGRQKECSKLLVEVGHAKTIRRRGGENSVYKSVCAAARERSDSNA